MLPEQPSDRNTKPSNTLLPEQNGSESENEHCEKPQNTHKSTTKLYGPTEPMTLKFPTPAEIERSRQFCRFFRELDVVEPTENLSKKVLILDRLNKVAQNWMIEVLIKQRIPEMEARTLGGHIRTFGSYRLGVQTKDGDIDAVLVVPMMIEREDFFNTFAPYLRARSDVKNLRCVKEAYVPVMKFKFLNIEIDLLFCRINKFKISPDMDLRDPRILQTMDPYDVRSINGFRVADEILNNVPNKKNFRAALYAIKYWSKVHGLYSNILGFFGGITWAILVARVCQLYPNSNVGVLVEMFFFVYSHWNWEEHPVILKPIVFAPHGMTMPQWSSISRDRNLLASIITPTYPEQNTCHNLTMSTRSVIVNKLKESNQIVKDIQNNKAEYKDLFIPSNFFWMYVHFIMLTTHSDNDNDILEWNGFVESRIRVLVQTLEQNIFIRCAHPYSKCFEPKDNENLKNCRRWFIGLDINKAKEDTETKIKIDLNVERKWFENDIYYRCKGKRLFPGKHVSFAHVRRSNLSEYISSDYLVKVKKYRSKNSNKTSLPRSTEQHDNLLPIGVNKRKISLQEPLNNGLNSKKIPKIGIESSLKVNGTSLQNETSSQILDSAIQPSSIESNPSQA